MNRVGLEKGVVGYFISNNVKYKLRQDLCKASSQFESCFVEIENDNMNNLLIGVIHYIEFIRQSKVS